MCPSDRSGVGAMRSIWPAQQLKRAHGDEVEVHLDFHPDVNNLDYLSKFDIIHFHRMLGPYDGSEVLFTELKRRGVKLIMDIDDYWMPPPTHHLYAIILADKMNEQIENNLRLADWITTTTDIFAEEIRKFNPNVMVFPNAINREESMWASETVPDPLGRTRITWIGGSSHMHDLIKIKDSMALLASDKGLHDKFQFLMCGFDVRGSITEINGSERRVRPIQKHETIWMEFERIFTNDYALIDDPEYKKWLLKIENKEYPKMYEQNYVRRWTLPLTQYARHYDYCDICLAPLAETYEHRGPTNPKTGAPGPMSYRENLFNKMKSALKILEAGMKRKALIAQDFGIYSELIEDGVNGILVNKSDDKKGWYKAIKRLVNDPELRMRMADNLHEMVKERYDINVVNEQRLDFYKSLVGAHKEAVA